MKNKKIYSREQKVLYKLVMYTAKLFLLSYVYTTKLDGQSNFLHLLT
jgi:hypothetical protein